MSVGIAVVRVFVRCARPGAPNIPRTCDARHGRPRTTMDPGITRPVGDRPGEGTTQMRSRFGSLRARTTVLVATGMASALAIAALIPSIAPAANRPDGPSSASGSGGANAVQAVTMPNDGDSPAAAAAAASAQENAALAAP